MPSLPGGRPLHPIYRHRALWVDDRDISQPEELRAVCDELGISHEPIARAGEPENKHALLAAGARALELGLCGAPTCVVDGRLYWGQDRLQLVEAALRGFRAEG